jgi:hypothetical protein
VWTVRQYPERQQGLRLMAQALLVAGDIAVFGCQLINRDRRC